MRWPVPLFVCRAQMEQGSIGGNYYDYCHEARNIFGRN